MAFASYLGDFDVDAETNRVLDVALEMTRAALGLADDFANGIIARQMIELARAGERNPELTAPLLSPSLFSVRGPRQRAQGRREGLQATSRQRSARASSYGVLPRSDPQGRDTYTVKQPSRLHLGSHRHRAALETGAVAITIASFIYSVECGGRSNVSKRRVRSTASLRLCERCQPGQRPLRRGRRTGPR
jgi:hypothetical protein